MILPCCFIDKTVYEKYNGRKENKEQAYVSNRRQKSPQSYGYADGDTRALRGKEGKGRTIYHFASR
jgi:hypothetical protein